MKISPQLRGEKGPPRRLEAETPLPATHDGLFLSALLRSSAGLAALIFERGEDGVSRVTDATDAACLWLRRERDDLRGQSAAAIFGAADQPGLAGGGLPGAAAPHAAVARLPLPPAAGEEPRTVLLAVYGLQTAAGERHLALLHDLPGDARASLHRGPTALQAQHEEKLKSLEILAGGIAHDFNNLLVGVLGNADLALMDMSPFSPARASVEAIKAAAVQATELTMQMLAFAGKGRLAMERLNIEKVVLGISHLMKASASPKATLHCAIEPNLPPVDGDVSQIRQLLLSLLSNAADSIRKPAGQMEVRIRMVRASRDDLARCYVDENLPDGDYVAIEVRDDGCGMDEATQARLFDPFFSTKPGGRGLGLAAVLGIVRTHRGAVRVASEPDRGTTFTVLLPAAARPEAEDLALHSIGPAWTEAGGAVLLVDDEEAVRTVVETMLTRAGFPVLCARGGPEGVERLRAHPAAVGALILNLTMPGMSGEQVLEEIDSIRPGLKVIVCTGYPEEEARARFGRRHIDGFIRKPFAMETLLTMVGRFFGPPPRQR